MANPQVVVDFVANTRDLQTANRELASGGGRAAAAVKRGFAPAVAVLGAATVAAKKTVDAASALNEQMAASQQVFGKHAKSVQNWAKTGAESFGLSTTESLKAANAYGNMFNTVGLGSKQVKGMSQSMVQLAGDMASFHDQDPSDMLDRLRSGLSGEAEPLRRFGVLISDAAVKQEAYRQGIAKHGAELTEAQKVQARYALIMKQTSKAQGDFARTGDSVANQQRTLAAENENAAASFGQALLPATQAFQKVLMKLVSLLTTNKGVLTAVAGAVVGLAAAVVLINGAMKVYEAGVIAVNVATKAWAAATWLVNAAMRANPIGLVITAITLLVAGLVLAYTRSETFRKIVQAAFKAVLAVAKALFGWLKQNWPLLLSIIAGPVGLAVALVVKNWDKVKSVTQSAWNAVKGTVSSVTGAIRNVLSGFKEWVAGPLLNAIRGATDRIGNVFDNIADGARAAYGAVKSALNNMLDWLRGLISKVHSVATSIGNAIKAPINAVIGAWNSLGIPRVAITLPRKKILGKTIGGGSFGFGPFPFPDIPRLAAGGIVTGPTLAMIGEAGPEAVVPLDRAATPALEVRVFIGDTELKGMIRAEVIDSNTGLARTLLAGGVR